MRPEPTVSTTALAQSAEQCQVAANVRLDKMRGDLRIEQHAPPIAGNAELDHSQFAHWIDDDHLAAASPQMGQRCHQSRVIAGRIAADDHGQIALLQIVQRYRGRAGAEGLIQSDTAGLMAIVAAVVDVVGAVESSSQLQEKAGFIAAAAAEIPKRFVGRERLEQASRCARRRRSR